MVDLLDPFLAEAVRAIASGDEWRAVVSMLEKSMQGARREALLPC